MFVCLANNNDAMHSMFLLEIHVLAMFVTTFFSSIFLCISYLRGSLPPVCCVNLTITAPQYFVFCYSPIIKIHVSPSNNMLSVAQFRIAHNTHTHIYAYPRTHEIYFNDIVKAQAFILLPHICSPNRLFMIDVCVRFFYSLFR